MMFSCKQVTLGSGRTQNSSMCLVNLNLMYNYKVEQAG